MLASELIVKWVGLSSGIVTLLLGAWQVFGGDVALWLSLAVTATFLCTVYYWQISTPFDLAFESHAIELDILDPTGATVAQTRKTTLRALRSGVDTITDHMSADGTMEDPTVEPGAIKTIRREGGDLFVTSTLDHPLRKGEVAQRCLRAKLLNSFVDSAEYWSVRISHPMPAFTLVVKFPPERSPKSYRGKHRISTAERLTRTQPVLTSMNGKPTLTWSVARPQVKDVYKIEWEW